jgi:hypothetical protein
MERIEDGGKRAKGSWYMHTLNGQPAAYDERAGYIFYIGRRLSWSPLVADLATIRRQQARALADDARGWNTGNVYGYICFARKAAR